MPCLPDPRHGLAQRIVFGVGKIDPYDVQSCRDQLPEYDLIVARWSEGADDLRALHARKGNGAFNLQASKDLAFAMWGAIRGPSKKVYNAGQKEAGRRAWILVTQPGSRAVQEVSW